LSAIGLLRPLVRRAHAGDEELMRCQGELVALLGRAFEERSGAIHLRAATPGARELAVDEGDATAFGPRRRQLVFRNDGVRRGGEESVLLRRQHLPRIGAGARVGRTLLRSAGGNAARRGRNAGSADARALQEFASWKLDVSHGSLPC